MSGDGRPELVRQTGARPHIYNFAPVPSLAPLVPSSSRGKTPLAHRWKYACKVLWSRALFRPRLLAGVEARLVEALVMAKALAAATWVASLEPELAPSHSCSCPSTCSRMVSVCIPDRTRPYCDRTGPDRTGPDRTGHDGAESWFSILSMSDLPCVSS